MNISKFKAQSTWPTCRHLVPCPPDEALLQLTAIGVIRSNYSSSRAAFDVGQIPGRSLDRDELPGMPSSIC